LDSGKRYTFAKKSCCAEYYCDGIMTKEELMALLRNPGQTGQAVDELNRVIEEYPYFHTGHQLYIKGLQQSDEEKMMLRLGKTALSVRDRGVLYQYMNVHCTPEPFLPQQNSPDMGAEMQNAEEQAPSSENDLIDAFLKSNHKIVPDENIQQVDLSESLQENLDIATDTLAEIYAAQGHINKAIEIYEHLNLKYPEKHIYFAAQIERLKVKK